MKNEDRITTRMLLSLGKLSLCVLLFPYQIAINRKEKSFSTRSILVSMRLKRKTDESGKPSTQVTFNTPGFLFGEAKESLKKRFPKKEKKKLVLRRKLTKKAKAEEDDA